MGFRRQVVEGLVDRQLLGEDAKRLGFAVSDDEVTRELAAGRAHVSLQAERLRQVGYALGLDENLVRLLPVKNPKTNKFDPKVYEREIRSITKMSPVDFRDFERKELLAERMRDVIRERVHVGESEAFEQFSSEKSTATIQDVRLDRRFFADVAVDKSPKAVDAWAEKNKADIDKAWDTQKKMFQPECRVVRHILARIDPEATDPDADKAKAKKRIEDAIARVSKGERFADVARETSDDTSASDGGDLGCVPRGKTVKPFEDAAYSLDAGKMSGVVETQFGFHVLEVEQIAKGPDAEKVARSYFVKDRYTKMEAERLSAEAAKQILAAVRSGKTMDEAVKAFVATLPRPAGDKAKKADEAKAKADDATKGDDAAKADAKPGARFSIEEHPQRPTVETSMPFTVSGDPLPGAQPGTSVSAIAFGLKKPGDVPNDVIPMTDGYAVIQLKEKTAASKEDWEKNRDYYVSAMRSAKQSDALAAYVKRLRDAAGTEIKLSPAVVNEPKPDAEGATPPDGEDAP
jgi:peptidyl-prolyl cis-trans isomerase D